MFGGNYYGQPYFGQGYAVTLANPLPDVLVWHVAVDWNADGVYDEDEGARLLGMRSERGRESIFDDPMVGTCDLTLQNADRRYDSWYTSSPLYPNIRPGRKVQVSCDLRGIRYFVFTGRLQQPDASNIKAAGAEPAG